MSSKAAVLALKIKELIELHVGEITPKHQDKTLDISLVPKQSRSTLYQYVMKWLFCQARVTKEFRHHQVMHGVMHIVKYFLFVGESGLLSLALRQGAIIEGLDNHTESDKNDLLQQVHQILDHLPKIKSLLWMRYMIASELLYLNEHYQLQQHVIV
jgi:hypothetical protein